MTRVAFAGGRPVGRACLTHLLQCMDVEVVGVFVNPDDFNSNRWYEGQTVAEIAVDRGIQVHKGIQQDWLADLYPDILIVAYFDRILKRDVIDVPSKGCINLHLALAEEYRGCYPTTWAIINGETRTGVTLHYIDEGMDTGDIIAQREIAIEPDDTGKSLYMKLSDLGSDLFHDMLPSILDGTAPRRPQVTTSKTRTYHRIFPSREIDFNGSGQDAYNKIRALVFPPFPMPVVKIGQSRWLRLARLDDV